MALSTEQLQKVQQCVVDQLDDITPDRLESSMQLREDLDFDSLLAANLSLDIEEAFGVTIEESEVGSLVTLQDVYDLLEKKLS